MKKGIYLILCILLLLTLGGCASNHDASASSEIQAGTTENEEGAEEVSASDTDGTPILETLIYEYETQELYARRDENQIYGLLYVSKNAGEKMAAVIFSYGFGGNYQVGTQYAEALAGKGYVVDCFDLFKKVLSAGLLFLL